VQTTGKPLPKSGGNEVKKFLLAVIVVIALTGATNAFSLDPKFLSFGEMNGTYQGSGWVKGKFVVGCHMIQDEDVLEECSPSRDDVNVREKPNGRVIAAITKGVPIIVNKRQRDWVEVWTYCPDNLIPSSSLPNGVVIYSCEERPK
jgi:hypothetical protein